MNMFFFYLRVLVSSFDDLKKFDFKINIMKRISTTILLKMLI